MIYKADLKWNLKNRKRLKNNIKSKRARIKLDPKVKTNYNLIPKPAMLPVINKNKDFCVSQWLLFLHMFGNLFNLWLHVHNGTKTKISWFQFFLFWLEHQVFEHRQRLWGWVCRITNEQCNRVVPLHRVLFCLKSWLDICMGQRWPWQGCTSSSYIVTICSNLQGRDSLGTTRKCLLKWGVWDHVNCVF